MEGLHFFAGYISEGWLSSPRETHCSVVNSFKTLGANLHFNEAEKEFTIASFLKQMT